ncbi:MAG: CPBP family intramembrane glutamic endopeptidase [bacterium]
MVAGGWQQVLPVFLLSILLSASLSAALALLILLVFRPPRVSTMALNMATRPWSMSHVTLLTATVMCGIAAVPLLLQVAQRLGLEYWQVPPYTWLLAGAVFTHIPCLAMIRVVMHFEHISFEYGFGITRGWQARRLATGVFLSLSTLPALAVVMILYQWVLTLLGAQYAPQSVAVIIKDTAIEPWYVQAAAGILAVTLIPAVEELVFRGIVLPAAVKRIGFLPGVLLVSLVFAVIHVEIATYAPLFVLSVALCLAYAYSNSIIVPIAMHATHNLIQVALLPFVSLQ